MISEWAVKEVRVKFMGAHAASQSTIEAVETGKTWSEQKYPIVEERGAEKDFNPEVT